MTNAVATVDMSTDDLGKNIRARIMQGDKAAGKAEDHYIAAGLHLKEARDRIAKDGGNFRDFLKKHEIGHSRAYDLLAVADGKKTFAGIRAKAAERAARHAEKNRVARESVSNRQVAPPDDKASVSGGLAGMLFGLIPAPDLDQYIGLFEKADLGIVVAELRRLGGARPAADNNDDPDFIPAFLKRGAA